MTSKHFPFIQKAIATSCGFGFFPYGPGTMGALFGILLWLPLYLCASNLALLLSTAGAILVFTPLGIRAANEAERHWGPDPSKVVIDETVGQWISLLPVCSVATDPWWLILLAFAAFRFFDIAKPLGVRRMEALPAGLGVMMDDILAGIYGAIIVIIVKIFALP